MFKTLTVVRNAPHGLVEETFNVQVAERDNATQELIPTKPQLTVRVCDGGERDVTFDLNEVVHLEVSDASGEVSAPDTVSVTTVVGAGGAHLGEIPVGGEIRLGDGMQLVELGDGSLRVEEV